MNTKRNALSGTVLPATPRPAYRRSRISQMQLNAPCDDSIHHHTRWVNPFAIASAKFILGKQNSSRTRCAPTLGGFGVKSQFRSTYQSRRDHRPEAAHKDLPH